MSNKPKNAARLTEYVKTPGEAAHFHLVHNGIVKSRHNSKHIGSIKPSTLKASF